MVSLFGTSGIRRSAKELTNQFCFDIGRTFAKFLANHNQKGKIAVAMDTRQSSPRIKKAFSIGIQQEGYKVVDHGIVPVASMNYLLLANPSFVGSCMITGSHIRGDHNGFKFFAFKEEILKKHEKEIENIYEEVREKIMFEDREITLEKSNEAKKKYEEMLLNIAHKPYPKYKVVIDLCNGCQSEVIPTVLSKLGLEIIVINNSLDPKKFLARDTETEEAVKQLQQKVIAEKADLGIAYDGDGDRVVFVDNEGNFIPGDYTGTLIAKYSSTPVVVTPINTSQVVETIGKRVIRTKVGSPYVVETMKKYGSTFGFEANGGGISAEIMLTRDGGSTTIKMLNLLKTTKQNLKELVGTLPKFYLYRTKVECPRELNNIIIQEAKKKYQGKKIEDIDGLKVWTDDSTWILFRPSSNASEFRVFAEAKTESEAKKLGTSGIEFVKSFIK